MHPSGLWLASGGDDGTVRIWELLSGRQIWSVKISGGEAVNVVRWRPNPEAVILSAATGEDVYLIVPSIIDPEVEATSREVLDAGWGYAVGGASSNRTKEPATQWARPGTRLEDEGVLVKFSLRSTVKVISWHRRGEYFSTVSPNGQTSAVAIHTLSVCTFRSHSFLISIKLSREMCCEQTIPTDFLNLFYDSKCHLREEELTLRTTTEAPHTITIPQAQRPCASSPVSPFFKTILLSRDSTASEGL